MGYLTVGANNLDNRAIITSVSARIGRTSITQQPQPGTFSCQFYLGANETITAINIGDAVSYSVYDSTNTNSRRQVFSGSVTDITVNLNWSNGTGIYEYSITAIDGLADLSKYVCGSGGYAKDYEGNRIATILSGVATSYYVTISTAEIEIPGPYEIAVYNSGQSDAYTLCCEAANSGMGTLYWDQQNECFKYVTYNTRKTATPIVLGLGDVLAADFNITTSSNDVCNATQLTYGTGSLGTQYTDSDSITKYGVRAGVRNSTLHNLTDANTQAQLFLATRKDPNYNLNSITVNTALISDSLKTALSKVEVGTRININGLPTTELIDFYGFVESYTWTAARGQDILQMTLSSIEQQYSYTLWNQLNLTDTWNTYATATTAWGDVS